MEQKCSVCGLEHVGQPQHIFDMAALCRVLERPGAPEPKSTDYMRYGYHCANGHTWLSTQLANDKST